MPVSKKPRKKGKGVRNRTFQAIKRMASKHYNSKEQFTRDIEHLQNLERDCSVAQAQLGWMIALTEFDNVQTGFLRSLSALERWNITTDPEDFNIVTSSLMLGILIHDKAKIAEIEVLRDMQHASFMCVVCARLRSKNQEIPKGNIDSVRDGLVIAQQVMEVAYEEDRQAFIDALCENSPEYLQKHPELVDQHYKMALGRNWKIVDEWDRKDPLLRIVNENGKTVVRDEELSA